MGSLIVVKSGMLSTIQDEGRFGYRGMGVPVSGAMDNKAMRDANFIVGNPGDYPVIEHTFYGGSYKFQDSCIISITGAPCSPLLNQVEISQFEPIEVQKGHMLEVQYPKRGCRSYVAIQGIFHLPKVMDSYSTYLPAKFGGFEGRALQKGDKLSWHKADVIQPPSRLQNDFIPYFSTKITIEINQGPEFDWLDDSQKQKLFSSEFEVDSKSNRMGIRLNSNRLSAPNIQMVSSPVCPGIIQLPPSGNPIILMNDGQTIGGYPRIGMVREDDLWRLGQVKPGDKIRFRLKK